KWTRGLIKSLCRGTISSFQTERVGAVVHRPYCRQNIFYDRIFNEYYKERIFPTIHHPNLLISAMGSGASKDFSALVANILPDLEFISKGQCFSLYLYEKIEAKAGELDLSSTDHEGE